MTLEQLAVAGYLVMLLWIAVCLSWGHRTGKVNLWEIVTTTDRNGIRRTDGRKLFEAGAFVVMTATFVLISVTGRLTEWYAFVYVASWVAARGWRDYQQIRHDSVLGSSTTVENTTTRIERR